MAPEPTAHEGADAAVAATGRESLHDQLRRERLDRDRRLRAHDTAVRRRLQAACRSAAARFAAAGRHEDDDEEGAAALLRPPGPPEPLDEYERLRRENEEEWERQEREEAAREALEHERALFRLTEADYRQFDRHFSDLVPEIDDTEQLRRMTRDEERARRQAERAKVAEEGRRYMHWLFFE